MHHLTLQNNTSFCYLAKLSNHTASVPTSSATHKTVRTHGVITIVGTKNASASPLIRYQCHEMLGRKEESLLMLSRIQLDPRLVLDRNDFLNARPLKHLSKCDNAALTILLEA